MLGGRASISVRAGVAGLRETALGVWWFGC